jgi:hypothetical protein
MLKRIKSRIIGSAPATEDQETLLIPVGPDFIVVEEDGEEVEYEVRGNQELPQQNLEETIESLEAWGPVVAPKEIRNHDVTQSNIIDHKAEKAILDKMPSADDIKIGFDDEEEGFADKNDDPFFSLRNVEQLKHEPSDKSK